MPVSGLQATVRPTTGREENADKTPRTARGRKTQRALLDAAAAEFGEKGFHDSSIVSITARAGVALGTFYTYFESKDLLFRALVSDISDQVRASVKDHLTHPEGGTLERERVRAVNSACPTLGWLPSGRIDGGASPSLQTGLRAGFCYRWRLNLVDSRDNASVELSGTVRVVPATTFGRGAGLPSVRTRPPSPATPAPIAPSTPSARRRDTTMPRG